jgi:hypothetical protein
MPPIPELLDNSQNRHTRVDPLKANTITANPQNPIDKETDLILAARAVTTLKRRNDNLIVYRSLHDFESKGKLARVSYEVFQKNLKQFQTRRSC